jgi:hypothetical protein
VRVSTWATSTERTLAEDQHAGYLDFSNAPGFAGQYLIDNADLFDIQSVSIGTLYYSDMAPIHITSCRANNHVRAHI